MRAVAVQKHMPWRRAGHTTAVTLGGERFYITANAREDSTLGEVFIQWGKQGSSSAGLLDIYAISWSVALQHGVPLTDLIRCNLDLYFVPNGRTDDPDIPRARSIADYTARRLAIDWLPPSERAQLGIQTFQEKIDAASEWMAHTDAALSATKLADDDDLRDLRWNLATGLGKPLSAAGLTPAPAAR
jgi:ribonucleoside-diphosphate reductase alpha chain